MIVRWLAWDKRIPGGWRLCRMCTTPHHRYGRLIVKHDPRNGIHARGNQPAADQRWMQAADGGRIDALGNRLIDCWWDTA